MSKFLASGQEIKQEVRRIFMRTRGRRVAIVAFVGSLAEAYLPKPAGLELVCWPKAPGTNPKAIRALMRRGVVVKFARRLHMKVYWSESAGAVVASANLSTNAYGAGDLQEAGVALASRAVDIKRLLVKVKPQEATESALLRLEREWATSVRTQNRGRNTGGATFLDWLEAAQRRRWKIHAFEKYGGGPSQRLRAVAKEETGSSVVADWVFCRKGELQSEDFVLCLNVGARTKPKVEKWVFVHRVVHVAREDKQHDDNWPFQAGQLHALRACPAPPFVIDAALRRAFRATFKELEGDDPGFSQDRTLVPSKKLLRILEKHYRANLSETSPRATAGH
ncbi:MAG: hypothetical protein ABI672_12040 [Vicinamibacteria bacterium]